MTAELLDFPEIDEVDLTVSICRESFADFVRTFWFQVPGAGELRWNWHLDVLCDEFQKIAERVFRGEKKQYDLVINVPPGTSKSSIGSILFPAWVWTRFPQARVLTASHTDALVLDLANKSRQVIRSEIYRQCFPEVELHADQGAKEYYRNTAGGDRKTCTVAGKSPIGFHGHFLIVDDPIDPKKVLSEAETRTAREFMTNVIPTRKVNKSVSVTVLIMQRLGVGDPTDVMVGESKKEGAAAVRRICLPAEQDESVEPAEFAGYYVDGLLDPERMGWDVIREFRARGEHFYQTQFLQRPFIRGGGLFKVQYFNQRVQAAPYEAKRIRYWDRASSVGEIGEGCATAGTLLARDGDGNWYVEHCESGRWEPKERNDRMRAAAERDRLRYGPKYEPVIYVEAEPGSSGVDAWKGVAKALEGFPVRLDRVTGDKETRAEPWACQCAAMNVYVVQDGSWDVQGYVDEHVAFPNGKLKDRVDASSGAFNLLSNRKKLQGLRTYTFSGPDAKKYPLRFIACSYADLPSVSVEGRALLAAFEGPGESCRLTPSLPGLMDRAIFCFADVDPAEHQETWDRPLGNGHADATAADVMLIPDVAKQLWRFLLRKRTDRPEVVVFVDDGDRRALSVALAVASTYSPPPPILTIGEDGLGETKVRVAPNRYVYETLRASRGAVV